MSNAPDSPSSPPDSIREREHRVEIGRSRGPGLYVLEVGPAGGRPLIVLNGYPGLGHDYLRPWLDALAGPRRRVVYYDRRGVGRSGGVEPSGEVAQGALFDEHAADLMGLLGWLGDGAPVDVLSHSWGTWLLTRTLIDQPSLVGDAVFVSPVPLRPAPEIASRLDRAKSRPDVQTAVALAAEAGVPEEFARLVGTGLADPEHVLQLRHDVPDREAAQSAEAGTRSLDILDALRAARGGGRRLVVRGTEDPYPQSVMLEVASAAGARIEALAAASHLPFVERPTAFVEAVATFLSGEDCGVQVSSRHALHARPTTEAAAEVRRSARDSIQTGDVALAVLPPYKTQPWLPLGLINLAAALRDVGARPRVTRATEPPQHGVPECVQEAADRTYCLLGSLDQRLAAMESCYRQSPAFFDRIVDDLARGGESVVGLSVWLNNVDVTLFAARLFRDRYPDRAIVLGGPYTTTRIDELQRPWIDAVVKMLDPVVTAAVFRAFLDQRPWAASGTPRVWINPRLADSSVPASRLQAESTGRLRVDYDELLPLLTGDFLPTISTQLNWGCPYRCEFCSNDNVYTGFQQGEVSEVVEEIERIADAWHRSPARRHSRLRVEFCDATANARPSQFEALCSELAHRRRNGGLDGLCFTAQILVDGRVTDRSVRLMHEAGFVAASFGLDSADDGWRRRLNKPGRIAEIVGAIEAWDRVGARGLNVLMAVGIPGTTESVFRKNFEFCDWAISQQGAVRSLRFLPFSILGQPQGESLVPGHTGRGIGVAWRAPGPAGDPAVRARRFMRLVEMAHGRIEVGGELAPYVILPAMLPDVPQHELDAWMDTYGRSYGHDFSKATDHYAEDNLPAHGSPTTYLDPEAAHSYMNAADRIVAAFPPGTWVEKERRWLGQSVHEGLALLLARRDGAEHTAVTLEPVDVHADAWRRTETFNIGYRDRWDDIPCTYDETAMETCLGAIDPEAALTGAATEASDPRPAGAERSAHWQEPVHRAFASASAAWGRRKPGLHAAQVGGANGIVLSFPGDERQEPVCVFVAASEDTDQAFVRTRSFAVSYLDAWESGEYAFDRDLVESVAEVLRDMERRGLAPNPTELAGP